ncbi:hypothetical protein GDO86_004555 [Hymenochirus boettgeri]|uniref:Leukemia-associated protein 7 n=1 Tax=Hymenochirus boettgeri TaxID=247094 RepID=A0A8T2KEJ9_9PIPI|nr:hypothetical protein GDO86_004555 [Hymenochirus boettgeri]
MQGSGLATVALNHQVTAFNILRVLVQERNPETCPAQPMATIQLNAGSTHGAGEGSNRSDSDTDSTDFYNSFIINEPARSDSKGKSQTLAQVASQNLLSRVTNSTAQLLLVEQNVLQRLQLERPLVIQLKDSIEFRNICTHMALQVEDMKFDRDVKEAQQCLRTIISRLISALLAFSSDLCDKATEDLKAILKNLSGF